MGRFNFQNKPGQGGSGNNVNSNRQSETERNYGNEQYYEEDVMPQEEYNTTLKDLWMCIAFCIVGWIVFCVGNVLMLSNDIGILLMLIGVIIVDLPCFRILLAGGSLGMVFGAYVGAERIIYYTDGTKKRDNSAWSAGLATTIFTWLITLVVGAVAMVIRIFKNFFHLLKLKREAGIQTDGKAAPWLPVVVGIAVFIAGFIGINVANSIIDFQESIRDDYSDEQTVEMLSEIKADMAQRHWQFNMWANSEIYLTVEHEYYADYDEDVTVIEVSESGYDILGIEAGKYLIDRLNTGTEYGIIVNGTQYQPIDDDQLIAKLDKLTSASIISTDAMIADIGNVNAYDSGYTQGIYDDTEIIFTLKTKGASGSETVIRAGEIDGAWRIRLVENPFAWENDGYVEFKYSGFQTIIPG